MTCEESVNVSMLLRIVLTIFAFFVLLKSPKIINSYWKYLVVPLVLTALDMVDGTYLAFFANKCLDYTYKTARLFNRTVKAEAMKHGSCDDTILCRTDLTYHKRDKIVDALSYVLFFWFFRKSKLLLFLIAWRCLGVGLFLFTTEQRFLIPFVDLAKEFMLYSYFFKDNLKYFWIVVVIKIWREHRAYDVKWYN